jgi:hypothetical protein
LGDIREWASTRDFTLSKSHHVDCGAHGEHKAGHTPIDAQIVFQAAQRDGQRAGGGGGAEGDRQGGNEAAHEREGVATGEQKVEGRQRDQPVDGQPGEDGQRVLEEGRRAFANEFLIFSGLFPYQNITKIPYLITNH